ncbi:MAG: hypothetical protein ACI35Q_02960 [Marinilabiliaceae bacterium]
MKSTEDAFDAYRNHWSFIEKYLPNYDRRDDVLMSDILLRFLTGDYVAEYDLLWIEDCFHSDRSLVKEELVRLETKFAEEALANFYEGI